jgi:hypothetical protein
LQRQIASYSQLTGIKSRLTTAGLPNRYLDLAASVLKQAHGSKTDLGAHHVDEAGIKQADPQAHRGQNRIRAGFGLKVA